MSHKDKTERQEYARAHYAANKESYVRSAEQTKLRRKETLQAILNIAKDKPCMDCGTKYPPYVMDFDHVRGEKKFNIATVKSRRFSVKKVLEEIDKCDLVCSNCHRLRTWSRKQPGVAQ